MDLGEILEACFPEKIVASSEKKKKNLNLSPSIPKNCTLELPQHRKDSDIYTPRQN